MQNFERTNYPLCLVAAVGKQLELQITYNALRFPGDTVAGMRRLLRTALLELTAVRSAMWAMCCAASWPAAAYRRSSGG